VVEHRLYTPAVAGSNPAPPSTRLRRAKFEVQSNFQVGTLHLALQFGVVVQLVRTPACHAGGRGFESRPPRHSFRFTPFVSGWTSSVGPPTPPASARQFESLPDFVQATRSAWPFFQASIGLGEVCHAVARGSASRCPPRGGSGCSNTTSHCASVNRAARPMPSCGSSRGVEHGCALVTNDKDFPRLSVLRGAPPKVVWLRVGNCATADIARLLRCQVDEIRRLEAQPEVTFLELR
jgi:hypothetical protein